jgi:hypothetical protein
MHRKRHAHSWRNTIKLARALSVIISRVIAHQQKMSPKVLSTN